MIDEMSEGEYRYLEALCDNAGEESYIPPKRTWTHALAWLDAGLAVRRHAWHPKTSLQKSFESRFCILSTVKGKTRWRPWLEDFWAEDWTIAP